MNVTEITACDERVFEDRNGLFTVLFSNASGLDIDEIEEIFSEYGNVWLVKRAGDERGIHFVTFETYDEAKSAVDGLEDHPDIQLKVYLNKAKSRYNQRRRQFNDGYNNNNNRWSNNGYDYDAPPRNNRWHRSQNNGYYNGREEYVDRREQRFVNDWADDNYDRNVVEDNKTNAEFVEEVVSDASEMSVESEKEVSVDASETSVEPVKEVVAEESEASVESTREIVADARENYERTVRESKETSSWYNVQNCLAAYNTHNDLPASDETVDAIINTAEGEHTVVTCSEELPSDEVAEVEVTVQHDIKSEDDKASITSEESIEPVILNASEVIVGNVNLKTDEAYLLHLFNKFEPLAVSRLLPVTPNADVRYCRLYFKDSDVAARVEKLFDRLCLGGRQIVVQRPNRLIATYMQQM